MRVTLLGVGEAFDPNEPNSAALVEAGGFTLLIDCGHSAVAPLWRACPDRDAVDAIYLTHHHADHVLGLIPVLDRWASEGRRRPLLILTTAWGIGHLAQLFAAGMVHTDQRSPFPVSFQVASETGQVGPFSLAVAPTQHSVPNHAVRLATGGRILAWSGDGRPTAQARALYADAHLLFQECYAPAVLDNPHHCDLPTARTLSDRLPGPARIGLYHIQAGQRAAMRDTVGADPVLFVPDAGTTIIV